jgi:hypothetical protein
MINTSSKALEAQWKAQEVKQSPSMKMGTKMDEGSRRNEVIGAQQGGPDPDFRVTEPSLQRPATKLQGLVRTGPCDLCVWSSMGTSGPESIE